MFSVSSSLSLAVICVSALAVRAQSSDDGAISPGGPFGIDGLIQGEQIGVGAEGTTYVYSNIVTDSEDVPYTITLVQDATHISEFVAFSTGGVDAENMAVEIQCGYPSGSDSLVVGDCTMVQSISMGTIAIATTAVESGVTLLRDQFSVSTASGADDSAATPTGITTTDASGQLVTVTLSSSSGAASTTTANGSAANGAGRVAATMGLGSILAMLSVGFINA